MATTIDYGYADPGIGLSFPFNNQYGQHAGLVETVATGTGVTVQVQAFGSGTVYCSVDGGSETTVGTYSNTGLQTTFTLSSGLSDAPHDYSIRITGVAAYSATTFLQVSGATPALSLPARFGPTYTFEGNAYIQSDDAPHATQNAYGTVLSINGGSNVGRRFRATISQLRVMGGSQTNAGNGVIKLLRRTSGSEGAWSVIGDADLTVDGTGEFKFGATLTGLDGSQEWEYQVVYVGTSTFYLLGIGVVGSLNTTPLASQGYVVFWGDSITYGYNLPDLSQNFIFKVCVALGLTGYNAGSPGEQVTGTAVSRSATLFDSTITVAPKGYIVMEGVNDNVSETGSGGATTPSAFQSAATSILSNGFSAWPTMQGLVFGILPRAIESTHPVTDAAWAAAVAAQSNKSGFYSSDGLLNGISQPTTNADYQSDGLHPDDQGDTKIASFLVARLIPLFAATGYSASISNLVLSATVTLTIATGAEWTGDQTVTLAWGDGNSTTVTPTAGQMTATAAHTYSTPGTYIVTGSNGQGWTDPAARSVTATDSDSSSSSSSSSSSASSTSSSSSSSTSSNSSSSSSSSSQSEVANLVPAPVDIQVFTLPHSAEIVWTPPEDQDNVIVGYRLYRNSVLLHDGTDVRFTDMGLTVGTTYVYSVLAYDAEDNTSADISAVGETLGVQMAHDQSQNDPPTVSIAGADLGQVVPTDQLVYHHIEVPTLSGPAVVTLATSFSNAELRYTLNGKNPTPHSNLYTGPLTFIQNATGGKTALKVRAFDKTNAGFKSKIIRAEFRIIPPR